MQNEKPTPPAEDERGPKRSDTETTDVETIGEANAGIGSVLPGSPGDPVSSNGPVGPLDEQDGPGTERDQTRLDPATPANASPDISNSESSGRPPGISVPDDSVNNGEPSSPPVRPPAENVASSSPDASADTRSEPGRPVNLFSRPAEPDASDVPNMPGSGHFSLPVHDADPEHASERAPEPAHRMPPLPYASRSFSSDPIDGPSTGQGQDAAPAATHHVAVTDVPEQSPEPLPKPEPVTEPEAVQAERAEQAEQSKGLLDLQLAEEAISEVDSGDDGRFVLTSQRLIFQGRSSEGSLFAAAAVEDVTVIEFGRRPRDSRSAWWGVVGLLAAIGVWQVTTNETVGAIAGAVVGGISLLLLADYWFRPAGLILRFGTPGGTVEGPVSGKHMRDAEELAARVHQLRQDQRNGAAAGGIGRTGRPPGGSPGLG